MENIKIYYQQVISLFISEGQIQWTRYSAMLVVNSIFLTLIGFSNKTISSLPSYFQQILLPIFGIFLCSFWFIMTKNGFEWINFWITKARELEPRFTISTRQQRETTTNNGNEVAPITQGNKFKLLRKNIIGTEVASYFIIALIFLIYLFILINNLVRLPH